MKLYEISDEIQKTIDGCVDEETGEIIDEDLVEKLAKLEVDKDVKLLDIACVIKRMNYEEKACAEEIKKLQKRKSSVEAQKEWLKGALKSNLQEGEKLKDVRASIYWGSSTSVVVDCKPESLPEQYQRVTVEPKKTELKAALEAGEVIAGCSTLTSKYLAIR